MIRRFHQDLKVSSTKWWLDQLSYVQMFKMANMRMLR